MKAARGFSLLEVLVALVIMALALSAIMQLFASGANRVALSDEYLRAAMHARSQLAAVGSLVPVEEGHHEGRFEDGFDWAMDLIPMEPPAGMLRRRLRAYQVHVVVEWERGTRRRRFAVDSIRLGKS